MGVAAPAGKHVLTLVYQPPRVYAVGVGISMLSVIGVLIAMLRSRHQPRSQFA